MSVTVLPASNCCPIRLHRNFCRWQKRFSLRALFGFAIYVFISFSRQLPVTALFDKALLWLGIQTYSLKLCNFITVLCCLRDLCNVEPKLQILCSVSFRIMQIDIRDKTTHFKHVQISSCSFFSTKKMEKPIVNHVFSWIFISQRITMISNQTNKSFSFCSTDKKSKSNVNHILIRVLISQWMTLKSKREIYVR